MKTITPAQCLDCAHRIANQEFPGEDGPIDLCDIDLGDYTRLGGEADLWLDPGGHAVTYPCSPCEYMHPSSSKWRKYDICGDFETWADLFDNPKEARAELAESIERR